MPFSPLARLLAACFALLIPGFVATASPKAKPAPAKQMPIKAPAMLPVPAYTRATAYVTARDTGDRLKPGETLRFESVPQPDESTSFIMVDPTRQFQTIVGFGGAFTDAAAETFAKLPAATQQEVVTAYFSPDNGLGYTLGRININSCDFSSDTYSYDDAAGDTALTQFSLAHDLKFKIPFIRAALAATRHHLALFGSPWSPPAWMKTNNDMLHGGSLKPEDRQAWADYYVRFIREYGKLGVPVWGLTVQNEPLASQGWESCIYTGEQEHDFVRGFLGPALRKAGLGGVKLMIWDHNRGLMYQRAQAVLSDPQAAQYVWGTAYHWYAGDHWDNTPVVHDAFPDKVLLFTEGSEGVLAGAEAEWAGGERYGQNILRDLNHWSAGWCDWNLLLDERGGPNHAGNFCSAPMIADTTAGTVRYLPSFYYLGHFAKFIRPGARRVASTLTDDSLQGTAFLNPDGTLAVVVMNGTGQSRDCKVWLGGRAVSTHCPAHSIETVVLQS